MNSYKTSATTVSAASAGLTESETELNRAIDDLREMAMRETNASVRSGAPRDKDFGVTMQIPVELNVVLGSAEMVIGDLAGLRTGSTIALDRQVGEPVDVLVNGVIIARGQIILVERDQNRFGLRISEILS